MTVESTTSRISYDGSGTTGPFDIPFYFLANADITAIKVLISDGTETTLALTTDYTLTGAGDEDGGQLTLVSSLSSLYRIVIIRDPDDLQESAFPRNDPFPSATHEAALDRRTMVSQRVKSLVTRSLRQPDGDTADIDALPAKVERASTYLAFDADGDPIAGTDPTGYPASAFMATVLDDTTAADARTTLGVPSNAEAILDSLLTTTGDTIEASAASTPARKAATASVAAHATTSDVWTARETILTGSAVTFTDIADAPYVGAVAWVKMNAAHIWTQGATFTVQGGATYTTAANDWVRIEAITVSTFMVTIFPQSGMPAQETRFKVGSFTYDIATASGTQAITGVGFKPKAVIFLGAISDTVSLTVGVDDGTTVGCAVQNQPAAVGNFHLDTTYSVGGLPAGGTGTGTMSQGKITTLGADGFTLTWTKVGSPTGTLTVTYLAFR